MPRITPADISTARGHAVQEYRDLAERLVDSWIELHALDRAAEALGLSTVGAGFGSQPTVAEHSEALPHAREALCNALGDPAERARLRLKGLMAALREDA